MTNQLLPKRRVGRPKGTRTPAAKTAFVLEAAQLAALDQVAEDLDISRSEALRRAVAAWVIANRDAVSNQEELQAS